MVPRAKKSKLSLSKRLSAQILLSILSVGGTPTVVPPFLIKVLTINSAIVLFPSAFFYRDGVPILHVGDQTIGGAQIYTDNQFFIIGRNQVDQHKFELALIGGN